MTAPSVPAIQLANSFLSSQKQRVTWDALTLPLQTSLADDGLHISRLLRVFLCSCCIWSEATALSLAEAHLFNRTSHFSTRSFSCRWSDPHRSSLNEPVRQDNPTPYYKRRYNIPATWLRGRWQGRGEGLNGKNATSRWIHNNAVGEGRGNGGASLMEVRMETKEWQANKKTAKVKGRVITWRAACLHIYCKQGAFLLARYLWTHDELTSVLGSWPCEIGLLRKSCFIHH